MRKAMAFAAAAGLLASACILVASFLGFTMDRLGPRAVLMHVGLFVLGIPLVFADRWPSRSMNLFRGKPRWALRSLQIVFLLFAGVFLTYLALSHGTSAQAIGGDYVLSDHGNIVGRISQRDYLFLKAWELRFFASGWIWAYYALVIHWWFPRQDEWTLTMPD